MSKLDHLQPYPFERLRALFAGVQPSADFTPVNLSIGEPKHPTPEVIKKAMVDHLDGLAVYPGTQGMPVLRRAISEWIQKRFDATVDADSQLLPVLGSREALFSFAQVVLDDCAQGSLVAFPNPFYQIYEGASFLGGATPVYLNIQESTGLPDWASLSPQVLENVRLMYVCSPNNPTGSVIDLDGWQTLFDLSNEYNFVLASDECYSEIYMNEDQAPLGALEAAVRLGRSDFSNLIVFSSLSKRSNAPGLRSGFVAGDADWISKYLKYRTYHGSAMSVTVQHASVAGWQDEGHVIANRAQYKAKFEALHPILGHAFDVVMPEAGFYFWLKVGGDDQAFARSLLKTKNVTVLPGSFLGRDTENGNPGSGFVRVALVAPLPDCIEAGRRMVDFALGR